MYIHTLCILSSVCLLVTPLPRPKFVIWLVPIATSITLRSGPAVIKR